MKIPRFFGCFFLFCAVRLCGADTFRSFAPEKTASGIEIVCAEMSSFTVRLVKKLKMLDRLTVRFLKLETATSDRQPCRIRLSEKFPPGTVEVHAAGKLVIADVSSADDSFFQEPEKFQKLAEVVVFTRLGVFREGENALPEWFAAGLLGELNGMDSGGALISDVRYFPLLRALLGKEDPAEFRWRQIPSVGGTGLTGSALELYVELCRVFLLAADSISVPLDNALTDYLLLFDRGGKDFSHSDALESTILRRAAKAGNGDAEAWFREIADRVVFNSHHPRPGRMTRRLLDRWRRFSTPLPTRDGLPDPEGKTITLDITELPALVKKNFACAPLFDRRREALAPVLNGAPGEMYGELRGLLLALETPGSPDKFRPDACRARLENALAALESACELRARREDALLEYEKQFVPTGERYRANLHEMNVRDFLGSRGRKLLDETEKKYFSEP